MSFITGLLMIIAGAFVAGTSPWPYKVAKNYKMEHILLFSQLVGMFVIPWIIMFFACDVSKTFEIIGLKNILLANIFSFVFGIANILSIICLVKIGFVMNSVLGGGTGLVISTLTPFIFKGTGIFSNAPDIFSSAGIISVIAVCFMVSAIIVVSMAGEMRDRQLGRGGVDEAKLTKKQSNFYKCLCVLAGFMVPGLLFLNTYYGSVFINAAENAGCMPQLSSLSIWTFGMFGCVFLNAVYSLYIISKNKSFGCIVDFKEFWASVCSGVQYVIYLIILGFATIMMGPLGAIIGNGTST
ncbi:MAG: hypothetical protein KBT47_08390, partial [Armatimonadetes bacterium]|nr:hypothetical protein [Candidatus Hippobium faecium]